MLKQELNRVKQLSKKTEVLVGLIFLLYYQYLSSIPNLLPLTFKAMLWPIKIKLTKLRRKNAPERMIFHSERCFGEI